MTEKEVSQIAETAVLSLQKILQDMPIDMRVFSLAMRSLYAEKAVGSDTETAIKFRKLRDDTRNDAMVYLKGVLPLSTKFVASISEYFEFYEALEYDEWKKMLAGIIEETIAYRQLAETLVQMHADILLPLKKRQDEAKIIMKEFYNLQMEFEKTKKELEDSAETKRAWAAGLCFVPYFNLIAIPMLLASANSDLVKAVAKGAQSKIQEAAALTVSATLIPALEAFIGGIIKAAGFFSIMENELKQFEGRAGKAQQFKKTKKKPYYELMNKQAKDMKSICQSFDATLSAVRTDFQAIPTEGTDQNYVDKWLEKQKKIIQEKVSFKKLAIDLLRSITWGAEPPSDPQSTSPAKLTKVISSSGRTLVTKVFF